MDNFVGFFRKVTTKKLKVTNQLEIGNKAIFAGTGNTYYVDSDASNASNSNSGRSWAQPLATINGGIDKCTANQGDTIILAESHSETYTTTGAKFTANVAGITIIGLGEGSDRATLTFSHIDATTTISAANVTLYNILFVTGIDSVVTYGTISGADCKLINCETRDAAAKEVIDAFTCTTGAARLLVDGHKHIGDVATGDASESIFNLTDVSNFEIKNSVFITKCGTGVIEIASTASGSIVDNCLFYVDGTNDYSLNVVDTDDDSTVIVRNCFDLEAMSNFSGGNNGDGFSVAGDDVGAVTTALAVVDAYHDAPSADSASNSQMRDVIGNKTDTVGGNSIVSLVKQILVDTGTTLDDFIDTEVAAILEDTGTTIPGLIAALNNVSTAEVNTQVDGALDTQVPATPTSGSLNDILSKAGGGNTFDKTTDSLEALRDRMDSQLGDIPARTNLQTLLAILGNPDAAGATIWSALINLNPNYNSKLGTKVTRAEANIFNGTQTALFTVSGGRVLITHIEIEVTTAAIDAGASNTSLVTNPTIGTDAAMCAVLDINGDEAGTIYSITGKPGDALVGGSGGGAPSMEINGFIVPEGTIDLLSAADVGTGGALGKCELWYIVMDSGASVAST